MYVDPSGNFFLLGFIIGAVIGAAVGFGAVAYMDYQDDGEIFNGSIAWQAYLGATLFGGAVGGILGGYVLPALSQMSFSIPTGLKLLTDTAGFSHVVVTSSITITGGQVLAGAGTLAALGSLTYMFSKQSKKSQKERSTQHPSWVNENMVDRSLTAHENATNLLNDKYGKGNWKKGPTSDYNVIIKWLVRCLGLK